MTLFDQNMAKLHDLGLTTFAQAYADQQGHPEVLGMGFDERLEIWLDRGIVVRNDKRLIRALKRGCLKVVAYPEEIRYSLHRGLDKERTMDLLKCKWIASHQQILITGLAGVGKTWMSCAFAVQAARLGYSIKYVRVSDLFLEFEMGRAVGDLYRMRTRYKKIRLLLLDDFGLAPLSPRTRQDLYEFIDDRYGSGSLIVTSQLPWQQWHDYIGDQTLADAILDRLIHSSHKIELTGDSQRALDAAASRSRASGGGK